jgi:hypothetical protein
MKQYISEEEAIYRDKFHNQFSRKLAKWAIDNMEVEDAQTGKLKRLVPRTADDVAEILLANNVKLPEECYYTAWYLFNMSLADYPKSLKTDEQRALFVEETICDPDGYDGNVLACFIAKMCNAEIPIFWERMI